MRPRSASVTTATMGCVFLREQARRAALGPAQQHPADGRDGGEAEGGARGAGERGAVPDEDHRDEDATEGRPADHFRGGVGGIGGGRSVSGHGVLPGGDSRGSTPVRRVGHCPQGPSGGVRGQAVP